jgi:hypothetical protein
MSGSYGQLSDTRSRLTRIFLAAGLPLFWLACILLSGLDVPTFLSLAREDGAIENLQALVLVAGCLVSGAVSWELFRQNQKQWAFFYALISLGLLFLAGEEISWGQRMFGVATPDWFRRYNKQRETNVHNLKLIVFEMAQLCNVLPFLLIVVSAASAKIAPQTRERWRAGLWMPPPIFIPAWICCAFYRATRIYHDPSHLGTIPYSRIQSRLQEPVELILYIGGLAFVIMVLARVSRVRKIA